MKETPPKKKRTISLESVFEILCPVYQSKGIDFFPKEKKIKASHQHYNVPRDLEILAHIDATILGSAKNGMAFTEEGIYWHNGMFYTSPRTYLSWEEVYKYSPSRHSCDFEIKFGEIANFDISGAEIRGGTFIAFIENILVELEIHEERNKQEYRKKSSYSKYLDNAGSIDDDYNNIESIDDVDDSDDNVLGNNNDPTNGLIKTDGFHRIYEERKLYRRKVQKIRMTNCVDPFAEFIFAPTEIARFMQSLNNIEVQTELYKQSIDLSLSVLEVIFDAQEKLSESVKNAESPLVSHLLKNETVTLLSIIFIYARMYNSFKKNGEHSKSDFVILCLVFEHIILSEYMNLRVESGDISKNEFSKGVKDFIEYGTFDNRMYLLLFGISPTQTLRECLTKDILERYSAETCYFNFGEIFEDYMYKISAQGALVFM